MICSSAFVYASLFVINWHHFECGCNNTTNSYVGYIDIPVIVGNNLSSGADPRNLSIIWRISIISCCAGQRYILAFHGINRKSRQLNVGRIYISLYNRYIPYVYYYQQQCYIIHTIHSDCYIVGVTATINVGGNTSI